MNSSRYVQQSHESPQKNQSSQAYLKPFEISYPDRFLHFPVLSLALAYHNYGPKAMNPLIKDIREVRIDLTLVKIVKMLILAMEISSQRHSHIPPMPRLKNIVGVAFIIGKSKA